MSVPPSVPSALSATSMEMESAAVMALDERVQQLLERPGRSLGWTRFRESFVYAGLIACGVFSISITLAIVVILLRETIGFFQSPEVRWQNFFFSTKWDPLLGREHSFGIWALICGTMHITVIAMLVAMPLGLISAVYLSEYATARTRSILKPALELLAGVPTVVYGFFALFVITPILQWFIPGLGVLNTLSAGIAVGLLCIPTICSLSEDALRAVPRSLREGALGLGGTKFDVTVKVVLPAALSGIIAAFLLATARAIGETMIVALAGGQMPQFTIDPRQSVEAMTGYMVRMITGDVSNLGVQYRSMYAVGFTLFLITFLLTLLGGWVRRRFREAYE
jgi:phosphate transport system permease protein